MKDKTKKNPSAFVHERKRKSKQAERKKERKKIAQIQLFLTGFILKIGAQRLISLPLSFTHYC